MQTRRGGENHGTAADPGEHSRYDRPGGRPPDQAGQRGRGPAVPAPAAPALLYLHLLRRGSPEGLRWPEERKRAALKQLQDQGLASLSLTAAPAAPEEPPEAPPPEYALEDINAALGDRSSAFPALADEVERRLGKKLTANDLKVLYTLYDHLALPAEVICLLVNWCIEEMERKYGPGRKPFLSQIRREGFVWARKGIDTVDAAEQ